MAEPATLSEPDRARLTVVVLTYNRADQVLDTLARLAALPDRIRIVAVDNASTDGTAERIAAQFPSVELVVAPDNLGAAGRNLGVARVATEYVAFCDDDTWWSAGSLSRAVAILDAAPRVAVLNARVVVGADGAADETCQRMRESPLPHRGLPGPALVGFMAGACVFRTDVFRQVGGYEARLFIGGEETLVSLDVLSAGYEMVYMDDLVLHHHPSPLRDSAQRRRLLARNAAWVAWMRLPFDQALHATGKAFLVAWRERTLMRDLPILASGIAWAMTRRRVIPSRVQDMRRVVREDDLRRARQTKSSASFGSTRPT
ncbi:MULTISPECIES: glycosyltransferase family 2 protein [unclassified Caballeronia]|uniref:glycosyltransferase family 2 protein n=1 Tax=unclassified Caballeronia TaxID=2646786 RepID=UPI002027D5A1|nr:MULTISPECIES: glycosyltransferase [unclassified Caballeronia]MDR5769311.1 glycosyltransferase [Caballeronia sp. LZ028]